MGILKKLFFTPLFALGVISGVFGFSYHANSAQAAEPLRLQEQKIKAGLIYNFVKYSQWPFEVFSSGAASLRMCLIGADQSLRDAVDPMNGRTANQRTIEIYLLESMDDLKSCHVLYIGQSRESSFSEIIAAAAAFPILTISDIRDFVLGGGMVEFVSSEDKHIKLRLNQQAIKSVGLQIGDPLLRLVDVQ